MLITHARLITWSEPNQILEGMAILVRGDKIAEIGPEADLGPIHIRARNVSMPGDSS